MNDTLWRGDMGSKCGREISPLNFVHRHLSLFALLFSALAAACVKSTSPSAKLTSEVVFQAVGDSTDLSYVLSAAKLPSGLFAFATNSLTEMVELLDSTGHLVRTLGKRGSGPGELPNVATFVLSHSDSILVISKTIQGNWYDSRGNFIRAIISPEVPITEALIVRGDTMVVAYPGNSPETFGYPLHLLLPSGKPVNSFGSTDRTMDPRFMLRNRRKLAAATDSSFWSARMDRYQIELWDTKARLERTLSPVRDWFPPMTTSPKLPSMSPEPPPAQINAIWADSSGHIFVLLQRARPDWHAPALPKFKQEVRNVSIPDFTQYVEQVLEVLDSNNGSLLATELLGHGAYWMDFLGGNLAWGVAGSPDGRQVPMVWRLHFDPTIL